MMIENFDPNEKDENKNQNSDAGEILPEIFSGMPFDTTENPKQINDDLKNTQNVVAETAENAQDATTEIAGNSLDTADDLEFLTIQDVTSEVEEDLVNFVSDILDGIFD